MARVGADGNKYPPTEFSQKYAAVLAPKGKLISPKDVFGEEGCFDKGYTHTHTLTFTSFQSYLECASLPVCVSLVLWLSALQFWGLLYKNRSDSHTMQPFNLQA